MKILSKLFVDYAALVLLLPFSLVVGIYVFTHYELLSLDISYPFLYFYAIFALSPLYFLFFRSKPDLGNEVLGVTKNFLERFFLHKWEYLIIGFIFSLFFLNLTSTQISTFFERDQWILEDGLSVLPIDMIILPRLALALRWLVPIDTVIPLTNLFFILFWFCFLIYIVPVEKYGWLNVFLVFGATFFTDVFHIARYASFELPSALVSFVGMYGIWKRKYNFGLFLLIMGGVFKNTGLFSVATGGLLLLFILWQDGNLNFKRLFDLLDISLVVFLSLYFIANHWGQFYYIFVYRDGPAYLVSPNDSDIFWLSPISVFIYYLFAGSTMIFLLGMMGILLSKENKYFGAFSVGLLLVLRSLSRQADSGYAAMFVPGLSYFSMIGISQLWRLLARNWVRFIFSFILIAVNLYSLWKVAQFTPGGMHHTNSNFDEFIGKLARRFPGDGYIYQKDISIIPYLRGARGGNLDAIRFRAFPEIRQEALSELSLPGCKLIIISKDDLAWIGVSEIDFIDMGYSERPYILTDTTGTWVSYSKECNAWEYD